MSPVSSPKRMVWTKARLKVLADLVAAAPAIKANELAKQFNAKTRCRVSAAGLAEACRYYGIQRVRKGDIPKPQPWSNEEAAALRDWLGKVNLRLVPLDEVTRRMREISGHDVSLTELPESLPRRVHRLRVLLMLRGIRSPGPGDVPLDVQRELAARRAMVGWLDRDRLVKAVGPIIKEAMTWCLRVPGPDDFYDPKDPESWYDPEVFLDNVLRGFEEELREQYEEAGAVAYGDRERDAAGLSGSLFDSLDDSIPSASTTDTHAIKPGRLEQDRPVISAGS